MTQPARLDPVPPGTSHDRRQAFLAWLRYRRRIGRPGGCWGLYAHAVATDAQRRADGLRKVRQNGRVSRHFPAGIPFKVRRQFYNFIYTQGRCSFQAWYAWVLCKGPHPLNWL